MFGNIGFSELLLIALVALIVFGPQKLPDIGRSLGKLLREVRQSTSGLLSDEEQEPAPQRKDVTPPAEGPPSSQAPRAAESAPTQVAEEPSPAARLQPDALAKPAAAQASRSAAEGPGPTEARGDDSAASAEQENGREPVARPKRPADPRRLPD